jgi:hypothetical protein
MAASRQPRAFNWNNALALNAERSVHTRQLLLECGVEEFGEPRTGERNLLICDAGGRDLVCGIRGEWSGAHSNGTCIDGLFGNRETFLDPLRFIALGGERRVGSAFVRAAGVKSS